MFVWSDIKFSHWSAKDLVLNFVPGPTLHCQARTFTFPSVSLSFVAPDSSSLGQRLAGSYCAYVLVFSKIRFPDWCGLPGTAGAESNSSPTSGFLCGRGGVGRARASRWTLPCAGARRENTCYLPVRILLLDGKQQQEHFVVIIMSLAWNNNGVWPYKTNAGQSLPASSWSRT